MSLFYLLVCLFVVYLVSSNLSNYTTIGQYDYFHNFCERENKFSVFFNKYKYKKLFYCEPCHTFWLSIFILFVFSFFFRINETQILLISFINYKIKQEQEENGN